MASVRCCEGVDGTPGVVIGGLFGYECGCFQAWFGWLCSGVAPVALNYVVLAVALWFWRHRCMVDVVCFWYLVEL
ncbi:hypothetical protein P8452_19760 [Trifolium repens]|nr:hypothetical protein P8452_19760 [Trifolium repens]